MADGTSTGSDGLAGLMQGLQNYGQKLSNFWLGGSGQPAPVTVQPAPPPQQFIQRPLRKSLLSLDQDDDYLIPAYRFNETKPKEGMLESMPTYFSQNTMQPYLSALKDAKTNLGLKNIPSPEYFAAMALAEGRPDFGFNGAYDTNKKHLNKIYEQLVSQGHDPNSAGFVAAVVEKQERAKKEKVPFAHAWNGMGVTKKGRTGAQHAERVEKNLKALKHEKNKPIYDYIKGNLSEAEMEDTVPTAAAGGKVNMPDEYSRGNWKLI